MQNAIVRNAKWIVGCKIIQSLIQLVVGMLTARYLGPANYGLIDYAASITAFAIPVMQLGLQSTLVQEYVISPEQDGEIVGTHLVMNGIAALSCMVGVISFAAVCNPGDSAVILVCALYSVSLLAQVFEMLQYWFQAKLLSKYSSLAMLCSYIVVSVYKIYLLVSEQNVYWFALSHAVEYGVTGVLLFIAYWNNSRHVLRFSLKRSKELFFRSKHYIIATLMGVLYNRISNIFLMQIYGEIENGYYAAATTCTCITAFVFNAIIDTARPVILESRKVTNAAFEKNVARTYALTTYLSVFQGIVLTAMAPLVIRILYGDAYIEAVPVLQILVWNAVFSYMGVVRNIWILGEEKHDMLWIINLGGAAASVVLNVVLITRFGACGAAVALVLTKFFANVVMGYILKPIRRNNYLMIKGLNPKLLIEMASMLIKSEKSR